VTGLLHLGSDQPIVLREKPSDFRLVFDLQYNSPNVVKHVSVILVKFHVQVRIENLSKLIVRVVPAKVVVVRKMSGNVSVVRSTLRDLIRNFRVVQCQSVATREDIGERLCRPTVGAKHWMQRAAGQRPRGVATGHRGSR